MTIFMINFPWFIVLTVNRGQHGLANKTPFLTQRGGVFYHIHQKAFTQPENHDPASHADQS
jgi:hypothetical protein